MSDPLASMVYPGRLIVIGRDPSGERLVVIYAVTGRSPSSQARELTREGHAVWTRPTDPDVLAKGNPELLVYPAMIFGRGIAVSNGKQTSDIAFESSAGPAAALEAGLRSWSYEPDEPIFTPRISGCILPGGAAALSVIRRARDGAVERSFFEFRAAPGEGRLVSTYAGENVSPLPSFRGEPVPVEIRETAARGAALAVDEALGPKSCGPDFRVALACASARTGDLSGLDLAIINHHERTST